MYNRKNIHKILGESLLASDSVITIIACGKVNEMVYCINREEDCLSLDCEGVSCSLGWEDRKGVVNINCMDFTQCGDFNFVSLLFHHFIIICVAAGFNSICFSETKIDMPDCFLAVMRHYGFTIKDSGEVYLFSLYLL